jgi:cytochrome c-type biogenesis protein CcmH
MTNFSQRKLFGVSIIAALLLAALLTGAALAQDSPPPTPSDDEVNAIARQLYCPVCENIPLDVCPTQACAQWREQIRDELAQGWTEDQIKAYFAQQYGARVLATPPAQGLNWLVYIIPPVAFLAGIFILYKAFRSWMKPQEKSAEAPSPESVPIEDEYIARLEEEVRKP